MSLALPMIASSVLQSVQSMIDMFFVGKLGPDPMAAVGMSGSVFMVLATVFIGISTATIAMVSRAVGAGDDARASHVTGQSLLLTLILSIIVSSVGWLVSPSLMRAMGAEGRVVELGTGFLKIMFAGVFFMLSAFIVSGALQAAGDAVTPFLLSILTTVCNVTLNPILIFGYLGFPAMGVNGSAMATVTAGTLSFTVWLIAVVRGRLRVRIRLRDFQPNPGTMWRILIIGIPSSIQMSIRSFMDLVMMTIVAKFGMVVVAAYTVGARIRMIGLFPVFGFAGSAATMVGQNLGANDPARSQRSALVATAVAFLTTSTTALAFVVFASPLMRVFNDDPALVSSGADFLRMTALALIAASVGIVLSRALNGAGDTVTPLIITLVMLWGLQIPAAIYLSGIREIWGITIPGTSYLASVATHSEVGIWYAMVASSVLQAALTAAWFATGRWKRQKV
jgi:putative MATE family efflux protein